MNRSDRHEKRGPAAGFFAGVVTMLIVGIVVASIGVFSGWLSFSVGKDRTSISVDREELQKDTEGAMEAGQEAVDEAGEALEGAGDATSDSSDDS